MLFSKIHQENILAATKAHLELNIETLTAESCRELIDFLIITNNLLAIRCDKIVQHRKLFDVYITKTETGDHQSFVLHFSALEKILLARNE